jgi:hypothetical protein
MSSFLRIGYQLGFELSPIILTNGVADLVPGQMLPIVALTEASNFVGGLLSGNITLSNPDDYFAHFVPAPGASLMSNQIGQYPFANQTVAANAIIAQPLPVSMLMHIPVNRSGGYLSKFLTMSALKKTLDLHVARGGTFTVVTPTYIYTNCVLLGLRDATSGDSKQRQQTWQWDFEQPLLTQVAATNALNSLMSKLASGLPTGSTPTWSGPSSLIGASQGGVSSVVGPMAGTTGSLAGVPAGLGTGG